MIKTVKDVICAKSGGIKITNLYILKDTDLEKDYLNNKVLPLTMEEYFDLIKYFT